MGTVVLLVGAKAVGKSSVASLLKEHLDAHEVETDALILDVLRGRGWNLIQPMGGWRGPLR